MNLDYTEAEPVTLDVSRIVTRGLRLRRKRLAAKAATAVVVFGLVPGAITLDLSAQLHSGRAVAGVINGTNADGAGGAVGAPEASGDHGPASTTYGANSGAGSVPQARFKFSVTLPPSYGPIFGLVGDAAGA